MIITLCIKRQDKYMDATLIYKRLIGVESIEKDVLSGKSGHAAKFPTDSAI